LIKRNKHTMNEDALHYNLTYKDVVALLRAVREADTMDSFSLEFGDLKLSVTRHPPAGTGAQLASAPAARAVPAAPAQAAASPAAAAAPASPAAQADQAAQTQGSEVAVTAPMLGTFYRAPSPNEPAFVQEGDVVTADQTIGLVEAMKLFTAIPAGVAGRVVRVVAADAALIEFGQPLLIIEPGQG